jgi:hypothetical protein
MRWLRDWLAWAAAWTLVAQAPMWVAIALDVVEERSDPTLEAAPVPAWLDPFVLAPAVLVVTAAVLSFVPRTRRAGIGIGGAGLLTAAYAWTGLDRDVGAWYVGLSAVVGVVALVSALLGAGSWTLVADRRSARAAGAVAGVCLAMAGAFLAWTCVRAGAYWSWQGQQRWTYGSGLVAAPLLVVAGATADQWSGLARRAPRMLVAVVLGGLALLLLLWAVAYWSTYGGVVHRWAEDESPWRVGTPSLLAGTGFLAGTVAVLRRRGDLLALSVTAALGFGLLAVWQVPTWGRLTG